MDQTVEPQKGTAPEGGTRRTVLGYLGRWLALSVLLLALYFVPAGRLDLPLSWVVLGSYSAFLLAFGLVYRQRDPSMLAERSKPGPGAKSWDRVWLSVYAVSFFLSYVVAGLGVRLGGVTVPLGLQIAGWALFAAGLALGWWATSVNTFYSRVVRIQEDRGHHVVTEGPYRLVRHPGYLMSIVAFPGAALALGSWWGLVPGLTIAALYVYRTGREDRTLQAELPGYAEYAQKTRHRLLPGIW